MKGQILLLRIYDRYLRNSEAVGNYRASGGKPGSLRPAGSKETKPASILPTRAPAALPPHQLQSGAMDRAAAPAQPSVLPGNRDSGAILTVSHDRDRGITLIRVSAGALPPCTRINVFRNASPIIEDNLRYCPRVAALTKDKASCSIQSPDSGEVYHALTTSDEYNRQNKALLRQTLVGPVRETCRTPPPPPSPWRRCTGGQMFLCWTSEADFSCR